MDPGTVLRTKLERPPERAHLVPRPELSDRLQAGLAGKLTLVSAPAGFGKTTLVSAWLARSGQRSTWLALDEDDNDPARFLTYLVTALQQVEVGLGQDVLAVLGTPRPPPLTPLLTDLLNEVATLEELLILVLDDYHVIHTPEIHEALAFILEHQPRRLHVVVITREDPMLPLPRLRVRGEITEIYAGDLRFSGAEATAFLNEIMGLGLAADGVTALEARTEGWIAGLQLAALALEHEADKKGFIETFAGDDRFIVDYLVSEVLNRQPPMVKEFLLNTSILERLTAPLCDALTGKQHGRELLRRIEQANLFLVPLDHRREVYRYHQLFGEMLRRLLNEYLGTEGTVELHRRAGGWYEHQGLVDDAIRHLFEAKALTNAAGLIESVGLELLSQGQLRKLLGWIQTLPKEIIRAHPLLCVEYAWVLNLTGRLDEMEEHLQNAERSLPTDDTELDHRIQGMIATIRAGVARKQHVPAEAVRQLRIALEHLPAGDLLLRSSANFNLGSTYLGMGELDRAEEALQAAREDGEASGNMYSVLSALSYQADGYALQGQLERATNLYREAIALGNELNKGQPHPLTGFAYAALGRVQYEQNDLETAEKNLRQAVSLGKRLGDKMMVRRGLAALVRLQHALGDRETAHDFWQQVVQLAKQYRDPLGEAFLEAYRVRLMLTQAESPREVTDWPIVEQWVDSYLQHEPDARDYQEEFAQLTLAQVESIQGQLDQALKRLAVLVELARSGHRHDSLIHILVIKAMAEAAQGGISERALDTLGQALELGQAAGYVRSFIDHGPPMKRLLERALAQGTAPEYAARLVAAFTGEVGQKAGEASPPQADAPVEPFTDREKQILRLMAAFRTNKEIAKELGVSVNTVKWYGSIIYQKLGVHKRAEAVARARELELL